MKSGFHAGRPGLNGFNSLRTRPTQVPVVGKKPERRCGCGAVLSSYTTGKVCKACQQSYFVSLHLPQAFILLAVNLDADTQQVEAFGRSAEGKNIVREEW